MILPAVLHSVDPFRRRAANLLRLFQIHLVFVRPTVAILAEHAENRQKQQRIRRQRQKIHAGQRANRRYNQRTDHHRQIELIRSVASAHKAGNRRAEFIKETHVSNPPGMIVL